MSEEVAVNMPTYSALQRNIEIILFDPNTIAVDAPELSEIQLLGDFTQTNSNQRFLLFDSRISEPLESVVIIFCSDEALNLLATFKVYIYTYIIM
jgi:hypothetical protein